METGLAGGGALVAGASAGIGLAIARGLAREGAGVALLARRGPVLEEASAAIRRETGSPAVPVVCDLLDPAEIRRAVEEAWGALGGFQVLVTNAGGPPPGTFMDVGDADFEAAAQLTLLSAVRLCRESIPRILEAGRGGSVIMVTSGSVKQPIDGLILSNTLRAGVAGLAKSLANELGPHRIRVNVICPGFTETERLHELAREMAGHRGVSLERQWSDWTATVPLGRVAAAEEIADLAVYLASDRASYITGTTIAVDGGRSRGLL